jgi:ribosomal protein S18 acetylase RimI-like enzyme
MLKATQADRQLIVRILAEAFDDNLSVNYLIPQKRNRNKKLLRLMEYSFDVCYAYGDIFLNETKVACALILYPNSLINHKMAKYILDSRLILTSIGFSNLYKATVREAKVRAVHPAKKSFAHLWYIGVLKAQQAKGLGSLLLKEVMDYCKQNQNQIYLETSTQKNLDWYQKNGFILFETLNFSYNLYCFKQKIPE